MDLFMALMITNLNSIRNFTILGTSDFSFSWLSGLGDWEMFIFSNFASIPFATFGCYSIHLPNSLFAAWAVL